MSIATADLAALAEGALDSPLSDWAHRCHEASIRIVKSGALGDCRVARGTCLGVGGQHSWVVGGDDCYDDEALIVDPTLWSYDPSVTGVWIGDGQDGRHSPHGAGNIFAWGRPENCARTAAVTLTPSKPLSARAANFIAMLGPLDRRGWATLAHAPVEGWPSGEIFAAMLDSGMEAVIPIDTVGMTTDRNPSGLYLP